MQKKFGIFSILFLFFAFHAMKAEVRLPGIFSDNMVIQRDRPVKIWGWADKNESVTIRFKDRLKKTKADKNGHWMAELSPVAYG